MTDEQIKRFQNWLKNLKSQCPLCGENKWTPGEIVMPQNFDLPGAPKSLPVPMVQLVCCRCAYVIHFAANPIGLLPR